MNETQTVTVNFARIQFSFKSKRVKVKSHDEWIFNGIHSLNLYDFIQTFVSL